MGEVKLSLPKFLQVFTSNDVPMAKAMVVAGKLYKDCNTSNKLSELNDGKLIAYGIDDKEMRNMVLSALKKSGYSSRKRKAVTDTISNPEAGPSSLNARKRKRSEVTNEFLPSVDTPAVQEYEFNEVLDEQALQSRSTVVNRAPLMTAWSFLVAQRLGFGLEEALSIASVYTELNAISKGVSIGVFKKSDRRATEASLGGTQPFVELMGRRPLYRSQNSQWRALSNDEPVDPGVAFGYISRALRQNTPYILGALRLLVESYSVQEINKIAWSLYADFRPDVTGWGDRGQVRCETILALRKHPASPVSVEDLSADEEPVQKRPRGLTLEEYEAALDQDPSLYDDIVD
ncbi:unnamed protein product [Mycena citricolor]|uniref:Uncharacterized protein n=1 Tax=Mycena citricolor TaxID=2018698 RepID=A0AAD2HIH7_9AGAR|nr:unnamed protein product [Mycena citricolor]